MIKLQKLVSLFICFTLVISTSANAQFKKYKTKTDYNSKTQNQKKKSIRSLIDNKFSGSKKDAFGRNTGTNYKNKKSSKYVNLNPETAFGPEVITSFDFPETSLLDLTKHMQKLTGINLILDKDLKGKISIIAPSPITVGDAWKAYLAALNVNGYTLVQSGAFYKIVNSRDIRYTPTKIYTGTYTPDTENYVMRILPLKNIDSTEVTRSFRPFMSRYGRIIEIKQTNTIIVQDTGSNINRLVRLIKFIDVPGHEEALQIIKVKNSSAQEIAKLIDQILGGGSSRSRSSKFRRSSKRGSSGNENISKIIAETRTNSIIAMANAEGAKQLRALIKKLDVKLVASSSGKIHVYYLNHGDAETLAKTLSSLTASSKSKRRRGRSRFTSTNTVATLFNDEVKITADKANNALVVTASPTDYLIVKSVLAKLDIPRDQVYVEGLIMETNISKSKGYGISIIGAYGEGGAEMAGFTGGSSDLLNVLTKNITSLGGLFAGVGSGKTITHEVAGQTVQLNSVNALITAIATNSNTNVLATPQILALDNTEAIFEVGETVPTPEKSTASNGSTTVAVKEQKVALTLKITPQINKVTRFVKLKIDQKIADFSERQLPEGLKNSGIGTTTRSAITTVVVRDQDTIAMGGLMRDKETSRESKIPLLGDIPLIGWLFKHSKTTTSKVNLLFFLTPKILASYEKTVAPTMKDVLNRRSIHLKDVVGEDDPFGSTVKGLYEKAKMQEAGPMYDADLAAKKSKDSISSPPAEIIEDEETDNSSDDEKEVVPDSVEVKTNSPNYQAIIQKIDTKSSGQKK